MMNSRPTSKIVIGVGLAAVFGIGVSVFAVRAKHVTEIARSTPAPAPAAPTDQSATDATMPAQDAAAQTPTNDPTVAASNPAPVVAPETTPVPVAPTAPSKRHVAKARTSDESSGTRVASAASSNTPGSDNMPADTQQAPVQSAQEAAPSGSAATPSSEPAASDSQITADVKSQIATAAPNSNVNVTTTNGAVALAGSVPSQEAVDQARQAAQRVAGVTHVDASGLTISDQ